MTQAELTECIRFFNQLSVHVTDISTEADIGNGNKVVQTEYVFAGKKYTTNPLYYKEISGLGDVRDISGLHRYFGEEVYWLDIETHQWPKGSGESDLDNIVIDDMIPEGDDEFRSFLLHLANNDQTGYIQRITRDGRPGQYYHNLENNNHWHDLVLFIKNAINKKGQDVDREYFEHLIFNWDKGKRTSLNAGRPYKIVTDLYKNLQSIQTMMNFNDIKSLLQYKKQIILQGPPGTGKTRMAKEIAQDLIRPLAITIEDIRKIVKSDQAIISIYDKIPYKVSAVNETGISLLLENGSTQTRNYNHIIQAFSNLLENKPIGPGETYQAAIAKFILDHLKNDARYKIIQFHPSYSYEDFVRGIVAESKGEKIEYRNVNKVLGQFAKDAFENYELSKEENYDIQQDKWIAESFSDFKEEIEKEVEQKEIMLSGNIGIFEVDNDCFRYGKDWGVPSRLNFSDFKKLIKAVLTGGLTLDKNNIPKEISLHAHYRFTYYSALLRSFFSKYQFSASAERQPLKNYVLIIDEINRANLSSVLGELIYALEYRNEKVESIYAVDGKNELVLPPNLYIIGTMNTADRSVGHIDYAIRRRFAFVDVPAKDLSAELGDAFRKDLFNKVAAFFNTNLSSEFEKKEVQLGHSYFIDRSVDGGPINTRLEYEIKPILREYVRDGILTGEGIKEEIENLKV